MAATFDTLLSVLRQPEYTGENRCRRCTLVNLVITGGVAVLVGWLWIPAGVLAAVFGLVAIYFRGYLVPGTPQLTQRFLPNSVLALFGKAPTSQPIGDVDLRAALERADALDGDGPSVAFENEWRHQTAMLDSDERALEAVIAGLIGIDESAITERSYDDGTVVSVAGGGAGRWPSRPALLADAGAALAFRERGVEPPEDIRELSRVYESLRPQLDACPGCGGEIAPESAQAVGCCGSQETVVLMCQACGARIYELDPR